MTSLSTSLRSRIKLGIAGARLFNISYMYVPDATMDPNKQSIVEIISRIAYKGPYPEMHPLFMPTELQSKSISKNLTNLILDAYNEETLNVKVRRKAFFQLYTRFEEVMNYMQWDSSYETKFRT